MTRDNRTLDQRRAAHALERVQAVRGDMNKEPDEIAKAFARHAKAVPAWVYINGFGQTLALLNSRGQGDSDRAKGYRRIADGLAEWLTKGFPESPLKMASLQKMPPSPPGVLEVLIRQDAQTFFWAQEESVAYLGWLKKLAIALIGDMEPDGDG